MHKGKHSIRNPIDTGYGAATLSKPKLIDSAINPKPLPTYPSLDYMPTAASGLNDVVMTRNNLRFTEKVKDRSEFNALLYHTQVSALHGNRVPRVTMDAFPKVKKFPEPDATHQLNTDAYFKVQASAEHGFRKLDDGVYRRVQLGGGGPRGFSSYIRADGRERDQNKSINAQMPHGLTFDSETAKPNMHYLAPNHRPVAPVLAATPNF